MRVKIEVSGINEVRRKLGIKAAEGLGDALDIDVGVETRKMANKGADNAPVETGALKASIRYSTRRDGKMKWHFGSYLPYALRQEYEHKTKNAYLRRAYFGGHKPAAEEFKLTIQRRLGG